jgi:hypothetical protein
MVGSRLRQLPEISNAQRRNFDNDRKIYIDSLKAWYTGEVVNSTPNGYGELKFDSGDFLEG